MKAFAADKLDLCQVIVSALTLDQTTNFRLFQTERVCRQQFSFYKNGGKFSKGLEIAVGKGDIATL